VTLHEVPLGLIERSWLAQYPRVHVDLAHVMEDSGQGETIEVVLAQAEPTAQVHGEIRDPVNVPVQVFDDILHHLDEEIVWIHIYSHDNTFNLVTAARVVDKSNGSFPRCPLETHSRKR
jgi:hypothetical protein